MILSEEWAAAKRLIRAVQPKLRLEPERLRRVLRESNRRLRPLHDPLNSEFGLHRWLASGREEAYSDWLKWILEQISPGETCRVLGAEDPSLFAKRVTDVRVEREVALPDAKGVTRRTDLLIHFGDIDGIVVEVKKGAAGEIKRQLRGQEKRWPGYRHYIVLCTGGTIDVRPWAVRPWKEVCIGLRRIAQTLAKQNVIQAALVLAFVGAVEQNLLGFPGMLGDSLTRRKFSSAVADHIGESLEAKDYMRIDRKGAKHTNERFVKEGLACYFDAMVAVSKFRREIKSAASAVLQSHLRALTEALDAKVTLKADDIKCGYGPEPYGGESSWIKAEIELTRPTNLGLQSVEVGAEWYPVDSASGVTVRAYASLHPNRDRADQLLGRVSKISKVKTEDQGDGGIVIFGKKDLVTAAPDDFGKRLGEPLETWIGLLRKIRRSRK